MEAGGGGVEAEGAHRQSWGPVIRPVCLWIFISSFAWRWWRGWSGGPESLKFSSSPVEKTSARHSHMVNISLTPNPFPLLITWDNRFRTVGKENMSQENMLAGSRCPWASGWHRRASRRQRGRGSSLRGQLWVRCLSSLPDPQTTENTNPVTLWEIVSWANYHHHHHVNQIKNHFKKSLSH